MKKLRILVLAMLSCALLSFVACNNNAGSDDNGGGSSGGGSASLAPFAGTTWVDAENNPVITFGADGTPSSTTLLAAVDGITYQYTVTTDGDSKIAIVQAYMDGVAAYDPGLLKVVLANESATTCTLYEAQLGDWKSEASCTLTKQAN